jgi:hypothetical protein
LVQGELFAHVIPAGTKTSPTFGDNDLATFRHGFIHPKNHSGPSHPQTRRFATADEQDIHDIVVTIVATLDVSELEDDDHPSVIF